MMGPVARALECAHRFPGPDGQVLSILHRDLKPENLFLAKLHGQEALKILDFGIGKVRSAATQMVGRMSAEQGGSIAAFTPAYGAPEQWLPKRYGQTGPWTDVWGFALCAVEALTGNTPLDGDAPAIMGACIDETQRPTPRSLGAKVPDRVEAAFRKALAVDPVQRFHDIGQFWDEVEGAVGVSTPRITVLQNEAHDSVAPPPDSEDAPKESSLLTEVGATERVGIALEIPDLAFTSPKPKAPARRPVNPQATLQSEQQAKPKARGDQGMHLSVLRGDAQEQMRSAREPSRRGVTPGLELHAAPVVRVARTANVRAMPSEAPSLDTVLTRMMPAFRLIGIGVVIMIADYVYATMQGAAFSLGPVRAFWIAAPLVGFGVIKLVLSLVG